MAEVHQDTVVAALERGEVPTPLSCLSQSPDKSKVVLGGTDKLKFVNISPEGLDTSLIVNVAKPFQATRSFGVINRNEPAISQDNKKKFKYEAYDSTVGTAAETNPGFSIDVTNVAWSPEQPLFSVQEKKSTEEAEFSREHLPDGFSYNLDSNELNNDLFSVDKTSVDGVFTSPSKSDDDTSLIAVAGSNGTVIIWRTSTLLTEDKKSRRLKQDIWNQKSVLLHYHYNSSLESEDPVELAGEPEAILVEHSRPVTSLAWHPKKRGYLLTASQDGYVKLWERRANEESGRDRAQNSMLRWMNRPQNSSQQSYSWSCKEEFKTKLNNDQINQVKWSPWINNLFAMGTQEGFLIICRADNMASKRLPLVSVLAHHSDVSTIDWHPTRKYIIATGGSDRTVKVWDIENSLSQVWGFTNSTSDSVEHLKYATQHNANAADGYQVQFANVPQAFERAPTDALNRSYHLPLQLPKIDSPNSTGMRRSTAPMDALNRSYHLPLQLPKIDSPNSTAMRRSTSALSVNRAPKKSLTKPIQIHELAIGAEIQKIKWRPPSQKESDSVDHHDAMIAVACASLGGKRGGTSKAPGSLQLWSHHRPFMPLSIVEGHSQRVIDFVFIDTPEAVYMTHTLADGSVEREITQHSPLTGTWQHLLSISSSGECLVQSLARGERPIYNVPPSVLAIANLNPTQRGYGSLQIMSAHQSVPSGDNLDYDLTGLRRDEATAKAPGFFKEHPLVKGSPTYIDNGLKWAPKAGGQKEPSKYLRLHFSVTDSGGLTSDNLPIENNICSRSEVLIAPEVVHMSRFAEGYKLWRDGNITQQDLCRHNATVAERLKYYSHAKMWQKLAFLLEGSGSNEASTSSICNAMAFLLPSTLKSILLERADAGDVQTCVVICEVMEIIPNQRHGRSEKNPPQTTIPGLDPMLVRQWYRSYIDLLHQMCLFNHSTDLIWHCNDPEIRQLNMRGAEYKEYCNYCHKAVERGEIQESGFCKRCRQRVALCFVCEQPVKGVYVWCPGCGHGGHLEHALEWFGGSSTWNQFCPKGCGHQCNFIRSDKKPFKVGNECLPVPL